MKAKTVGIKVLAEILGMEPPLVPSQSINAWNGALRYARQIVAGSSCPTAADNSLQALVINHEQIIKATAKPD